jgi:hypothetical protein
MRCSGVFTGRDTSRNDLLEAAALPLEATNGNMLITIGTSIKADSPEARFIESRT